ncbi:MAG: hypothetical protein M1290_03400 [Candidatus Thermoplasmatota archaeon]|nr:hypothetical protein [Candidatus Thermoplasmatota archaeon]MCL5789493.1 hypothetical protein [Candidatus Thermoplasmatota archaeon]
MLIYSGYEDVKKRKILTLPYLVLNVSLLLYYLVFNVWISLFLVPVIGEYFAGRYSFLPYALLVVPVLIEPSVLTVSLAYSVFLVKLFGTLIRNFGRGDVKVLQTIAVSFPLYMNLPVLDSLFPPVMLVILIAGVLGSIASILMMRRNDDEARNPSVNEVTRQKEREKFWTDGGKRVYKIPFVTFITVGYAILLTLSLLRLV